MRTRKLDLTRLPGAGLGLLLLAAALIAWHLVSDAAGFFAPAFALLGIASLAVSRPASARLPLPGSALRVAGGGAVIMALLASLSLGAFLPQRAAVWLSPPLGRFGGGLALTLLAVALGLQLLRAHHRTRTLDALTLLGTSAAWVWTQTTRQAAFPTPPTTTTLLTPRLTILLILGLAFAIGALLLRRRWPLEARWCWRWSLVAALLGTGVGALAQTNTRWACAALLAALLLGGATVGWRPRTPLSGGLDLARGCGRLLLILLALAITHATTSEDLELVLLRNTVERRATVFWRGLAGDERRSIPAAGAMAGTVRDSGGQPLGSASVVVADPSGRVYSASSGPDGRYRLTGVPAGNYLPLAVASAHRQGGRSGLAGRVTTIRPGGTTSGVDFRLAPRPPLDPRLNDSLALSEPTEVTYTGLVESTVLRRTFTFANRGLLLDGGLVHEPRADLGPGPFPILLVIYPGEAASWESVSAPLADEGYVVVSYFPRRLLDLEGDLDDLRLLLHLTAAGRLSGRGDGSRLVLVGGSVSTVYTYLLARAVAGEPVGAHLRALIQYGGLFDLYTFRYSWESGDVIIDPGISELEYLLAAFGRPDTRPELYLRFSPRFGLAPGDLPPTLLTHAQKDIIVPYEQSQFAAAGLAQVAIPHQLLLYPDLEHYLDVSKQDPAQLDMLQRTVAFLREWTAQGRP